MTAAKVFLINKQDKYCPENNNGDYIIEAWSTFEDAEKACKTLDEIDPCWSHYICEMDLNVGTYSKALTEEQIEMNKKSNEEYISVLFGDDK